MLEYVVDCELRPLKLDGVQLVAPHTTAHHVHEKIIRCRDCGHCHEVPGITCAARDVRLQCWLRFHSKHFTEPNGFCSWAVPRDGGT